MEDLGSTKQRTVQAVAGDPQADEMLGTGPAAKIIGVDPRTVERWVDTGKIRGGRPTDPDTGQPVKGSRRWVDARHAVAYAVGGGRSHLVPQQWRHLIPLPAPARR